MLTTTTVPSDVKCIVLTAVGPGSTVTRAFDVTPSQAASMTATGLPTGTVTLTEGAYNSACAQVTSQTPLTWVSQAPVVVQLIAGQSTSVTIQLSRAGNVAITTSFSDSVDGGVPSNNPPTIATAASATPNPVVGTTATLSVLGADDNGEANLTYTWATTGTPPAAVSFGSNGTNAAKTTTATFTAAGTYSLQVTVKDQGGLTALSATSVTVTAKLTSIVVTPASPYVSISATQQFTAVARNQFSVALSPQPTFTWAVSGGGSISASGLFTAGTSSGGPYAVTATSSGISGTASVTVLPAPTQAAVYQIDSGSSSAVSPFSADTYASGGTAHSVTNTITTTGVTNPAPAAVYQTERYGSITYTLPNLVASSQYVVRLHFAELYWTATGKRVFNVSINGTAVLSNFDVYAAAGAQYKAVVRELTATANASGQIVIVFTTVTDNATVAGIEVLGLKYANGASCSQASQCQSGTCTNGTCIGTCSTSSCGTGKACDSVGNCVACTTGTACDPSSLCQAQTEAISCTTGTAQCFATGNKAAGTTCGSGGVCDASGTCGCALGMFACGSCLGWSFESGSGSTSAWSAINGSVQLASSAGEGSYSLGVANVNIDEINTSDVTVTVSLCAAGGSVIVPTNGFNVSLDIKFQSPSGLAFGDDGTGSGSPGVLVATDGLASWTIYNGGPPLTSGTWYHWGRTIPPYGTSGTATYLTLRFVPLQPWSGTIFLDNISLSQ